MFDGRSQVTGRSDTDTNRAIPRRLLVGDVHRELLEGDDHLCATSLDARFLNSVENKSQLAPQSMINIGDRLHDEAF